MKALSKIVFYESEDNVGGTKGCEHVRRTDGATRAHENARIGTGKELHKKKNLSSISLDDSFYIEIPLFS